MANIDYLESELQSICDLLSIRGWICREYEGLHNIHYATYTLTNTCDINKHDIALSFNTTVRS